MLYALLVALVAINAAYLFAFNAKDKRHQAQLDRLLLWRHDPKAAALPEHTDRPLYLPLEDDEAWNEAHGRTPS